MNKIRNTKDFYNHKYSVLDTVIKGTTMTKTASTNKEAQCGMSVSEGMNAALQGGTGIKPQGVIETYGPVVSGLSCPMHGVQKTLHNDEMFDKIKEYMDQEDTDDFDNGYKGYDDKDKIDADIKGDVAMDDEIQGEDYKSMLEDLKKQVKSLGKGTNKKEKLEIDALSKLIEAEMEEDNDEPSEHSVHEMELLKDWVALERKGK